MIKITLSKSIRRGLQRLKQRAKERGDYGTTIRIISVMMVGSGGTIQEAAVAVNVTEESVRCWVKKLMLNGANALDSKKRSGRRPKLTKKQKVELGKLLDKGPSENGFLQGGWNSAMIQQLILNKFGILFAVNYVSQLMRNMGFSWLKAKFVSDHHIKKKERTGYP